MDIKEETKWLCENAKGLEKFAGQWVMFSVKEGVVSCDSSLKKVFKKTTAKIRSSKEPFVFHVPSKQDLLFPLPIIRQK
jgi:hypothetical protein